MTRVDRLHSNETLDRAESLQSHDDADVRELGQDYCELESMARAYHDHIGELNAMIVSLRQKCEGLDFAFRAAAVTVADLERELHGSEDDNAVMLRRHEAEALAMAVIR